MLDSRAGHQRKRSIWKIIVIFLAILGVISGAYLTSLTVAPMIPYSSEEVIKKVQTSPPKDAQLYIPKIGVNVPFGDDISALETGAWHRFPERGDPEKGGNFILSAHRFRIRPTPEETRHSSAFYYINKVTVGDTITVDFHKKRYTYKVVKKIVVRPNHIAIEDQTPDARLTLYACTLLGSNDGREVLIARLKTP